MGVAPAVSWVDLILPRCHDCVYDEADITREKLAFVSNVKNIRRGRTEAYNEKCPSAVCTAIEPEAGCNPLWNYTADCAFPSATRNELNGKDAQRATPVTA
jgi:glutamate dehydrogenase (NADP+)